MKYTQEQFNDTLQFLKDYEVKMSAKWLIEDLIKAHYAGVQVEAVDIEELLSVLYDEEQEEYKDVSYNFISDSLGDYMKKIGGYTLIDMHIGYVWVRFNFNKSI